MMIYQGQFHNKVKVLYHKLYFGIYVFSIAYYVLSRIWELTEIVVSHPIPLFTFQV